MHSLRVEGVIQRVTSYTQNKIIFDYELATNSNVVFSSKLLSVSYHFKHPEISLEKSIEMIEQIVGRNIEIYLCFPLLNKTYRLDEKHSNLFRFPTT